MQFDLNGVTLNLNDIKSIEHDWFEGELCARIKLIQLSTVTIRCSEEDFDRLKTALKDLKVIVLDRDYTDEKIEVSIKQNVAP